MGFTQRFLGTGIQYSFMQKLSHSAEKGSQSCQNVGGHSQASRDQSWHPPPPPTKVPPDTTRIDLPPRDTSWNMCGGNDIVWHSASRITKRNEVVRLGIELKQDWFNQLLPTGLRVQGSSFYYSIFFPTFLNNRIFQPGLLQNWNKYKIVISGTYVGKCCTTPISMLEHNGALYYKRTQ